MQFLQQNIVKPHIGENLIRTTLKRKVTTGSCIQHFHHEQALHFLLSSGGENHGDEDALPKIYSPALNVMKENVSNIVQVNDARNNRIQHFNDIIESHYTLEDRDQFVGGMGENDGGVWFTNNDLDDLDTLDYWEEIRDVISAVKINRHGIPFGVYTSGIVKNKEIISNLKESVGISSVQVTLGSGDPQSYNKVVGSRCDMDGNSAFGEVCNFIVQSAESGFPVIAAVAGGKHAGPGSELAKALGAIDVVVYNDLS